MTQWGERVSQIMKRKKKNVAIYMQRGLACRLPKTMRNSNSSAVRWGGTDHNHLRPKPAGM